MIWPNIIRAILDDDLDKARALLKANPLLATMLAGKAKFYKTMIVHWLYAGDTPLHLAAAGYRSEICRLLLAAGADPNSKENHRQSRPLHYAADTCLGRREWNAGRQVETIRWLLVAGAEVNAQDKNGATALHRAVRTRGVAAARCLLERGADPLVKNKPGSTPFHLAVQNTGRGGSGSEAAKAAQQNIIKMFLAFGVSTRLKDGKNHSVLDCAGSPRIREMLEG